MALNQKHTSEPDLKHVDPQALVLSYRMIVSGAGSLARVFGWWG